MLPRSNFGLWISLVSLLTIVLALLAIKIADHPSQYWKWGMLLRLSTLCFFPNLSDDYLRFIFDGHITLSGLSPFAQLPADITSGTPYPSIDYLIQAKNYYSVYPPVAQLFFALAARIGSSLWTEVLVLKVLWLAGEGITLYLLPRLAMRFAVDRKHTLWYVLHPLVIIEGVGNLHLETWAALAMVGMLVGIADKKWLQAGAWLAMGISVKLIPILAVPLVIAATKSVRIALTALLLAAIAWLPWNNWQYVSHPYASLELYFTTFEFHASLYYIAKWIYPATSPVPVSMTLSVVFLAIYLGLVMAIFTRRTTFPQGLIFTFGAYLMTATTVNPWYLIPLLAIQVLHRQPWLTVWSLSIFLSYQAFRSFPYLEDNGWVFIAYLPVYSLLLIQFVSHVRRKHSLSHSLES